MVRLNSIKSVLKFCFRILLPDGILTSQSQLSTVMLSSRLWNNLPVGAFKVMSISTGVFSIILPSFNGPMLLIINSSPFFSVTFSISTGLPARGCEKSISIDCTTLSMRSNTTTTSLPSFVLISFFNSSPRVTETFISSRFSGNSQFVCGSNT